MTSRIQSLYKTAVDMLPGNCRMHHNYATTLQNGKEREFHLREAVRLWPAYAAAWANLGVELAQTGRLSEARVNTRRLAARSKTWSPSTRQHCTSTALDRVDSCPRAPVRYGHAC